MAEEIAMPRLGWTMEEGTLVEWLKTEGEQVETGEILFTVESDKALNEIETFSSGILCIPPGAPQPGDTVPVGTLLGYLLQTGEEMPTERASASGDPASPIPVPATLHNQPTPAAKPLSTKGNPTISPRARRIANELNISWHHIKGSGQTGRIIERDIRAVTAQPPGSTGHIRELLANRLWQSQNETAAVTLTTEADATGLVDMRAGFKASQGTDAPTYSHMIAKLTALALGEHPALNASWQNGAPHQYESVHLGLAIDTEGGLLVPVIRDADSKSLTQIATEARALALTARRHTLGPDALQGGTFTISNLGMYGIDAFTPIINLPQAAILGLGRIVEKPAVFQGQVVPRALMALSLTFDHRILDGGPAARFLDRVRTFIEQPDLWWKK